jgi:hypothetical protein
MKKMIIPLLAVGLSMAAVLAVVCAALRTAEKEFDGWEA